MHRACEYCETVQSNVNTLPGPLAAADQLQALRGLLNNPALAQILQAQSNRGGFGRKRRQANGLLNPSEEDKEEMLDAAGNINTDFFSYESAERMAGNTPAGSDPVFLKKFVDGCSDCYDISRSFPQKALDRHPMHKEHGRHMIF